MVYYFRKHINNTTLIRFIVFSLTSFYISWRGYMKRLFSLLLISSLVLTACGSKSHSESNSSEKKSSESKSATDKSESVDSCLEKAKNKPTAKFKDNKFTSNKFDIEIKETKVVKPDKYADSKNPNLAIVYKVKNKSSEKITASTAFIEAFDVYNDTKNVQKRLETGLAEDSDLYKKYGEDMRNNINKDGEVTGVRFFEIKDDKKPITIEAKNPDGYTTKEIGKKIIKLEH